MRLVFILSLLLSSAAFSALAVAAQLDIQSDSTLRQSRQSVGQHNGDIPDRPDIASAQTNENIVSASKNTSLGFVPGRAEAAYAYKPGLTSGSSIEALSIDKYYFSSEADTTSATTTDEEESGAATLPNALWLIGFGIFWILGARRNLDSSGAA